MLTPFVKILVEFARKICYCIKGTEGCKMISPHHSLPTNGVGPSNSMTNFANGDFSDSQIFKLSANLHVKPNVAWFLWRLP